MYCTLKDVVFIEFLCFGSIFFLLGYYLGFFSNIDSSSVPSIIITTFASHQVNYSIEAPGVGYYISGSVTSNNEVIISLPTTLITSSHNDQDKGIHLMTSSDKVTVIGQNFRHRSSGTFRSLAIIDLCYVDEYVYYGVSVSGSNLDAFNSSILVVGTEDNTIMKLTVTQPVTISVSNSTVDLTAGIQYSFVINRLQTVLIKSVDDLTGTKIATDKPVSVFGGHQCGRVPANLNDCDYLVEQVPPTTLWGRVYYTAPLSTRRSYTIKLLAAHNSTVVDIYCNNTRESYIISEGQSVNKTLSLQEYCVINSSKEVLLIQLSHSRSNGRIDTVGGPMMTLVPPTNHYSNSFKFSTLLDQSETFTHYINIIVLTQYYQPDVIYLISGGVNRSLDLYPWIPIVVNNITEAYSAQIGISEGIAEVTHQNTNARLSLIVYGLSSFHMYGFAGGSNIFEAFEG